MKKQRIVEIHYATGSHRANEKVRLDTERSIRVEKGAITIPTVERDDEGVEWVCRRYMPINSVLFIREQVITVKEDEESEDERI